MLLLFGAADENRLEAQVVRGVDRCQRGVGTCNFFDGDQLGSCRQTQPTEFLGHGNAHEVLLPEALDQLRRELLGLVACGCSWVDLGVGEGSDSAAELCEIDAVGVGRGLGSHGGSFEAE